MARNRQVPAPPSSYPVSNYRDSMNVRQIADNSSKFIGKTRLHDCRYNDSESGMECDPPEYAQDKLPE